MIAPAEASTDLRQGSQCQRLGEIHRDLARPHHVRGATRRQEVGAADVVLACYGALDVLDLDARGFLRPDEITDGALGHVHGYRMAAELIMREQTVEGALEIATVMGHRFGDEGE